MNYSGENWLHRRCSARQDRKGFNLNQEIAPADPRLNAGAGREWIEPERLVEFVADGIELGVIAFDVAQITRGPDNVLPAGAFAFKQRCQVVIDAPKLGAEVTRIVGFPMRANAGRAAGKQMRN